MAPYFGFIIDQYIGQYKNQIKINFVHMTTAMISRTTEICAKKQPALFLVCLGGRVKLCCCFIPFVVIRYVPFKFF
jgi:hypothetical protein